jgi:UDP-2,4-diacetamido-2,4,6-trideoxy-beta-L-altropyranose hydrolase
MQILFRVDGSATVGLGHIVRSVNIAKKLKGLYKNDVSILFLVRYDTIAISKIKEGDFSYDIIPDNAIEEEFLYSKVSIGGYQILFIDKIYNYSASFIQSLKDYVKVVMFHYVCEGAYHADTFILPSVHSDKETMESELWKKNNVDFRWGFDFIIINDNILKINRKRKANNRKKLIITTGGSDPKGVILYLSEWLSKMSLEDVDIKILYGEAFAQKEKLFQISENFPENIKLSPFVYDELVDADMAICTFGVSTYELMFLEIPVLSVSHAQTNAKGSKNLVERYEVIRDIGLIDDLDFETFESTLKDFINDIELYKMKFKENKYLDGKGLERVAKTIYNTVYE